MKNTARGRFLSLCFALRYSQARVTFSRCGAYCLRSDATRVSCDSPRRLVLALHVIAAVPIDEDDVKPSQSPEMKGCAAYAKQFP